MHGFASVGNLYQKMHFAGPNPATDRNPRNASIKIRKILESKKAEKSLEISVFFVFSCLHLNQTLMMCLQVISDAEFVLANSDAAQWHTSPLVKQELASGSDLPSLQSRAGSVHPSSP